MKRICRIIALILVAMLCFVGYAEPTTIESEKDNTKLIDGWYVSDDGEVAIKPLILQKINNGYSVLVQIRLESTNTISSFNDLTIEVDNDTFLSLMQDKAIQEFVCKGNGRYSFRVACDVVFARSPTVTGVSMTKEFSFSIN